MAGTYNYFTLVGFSVRFRVGRREAFFASARDVHVPGYAKTPATRPDGKPVIATFLSLTTPWVQANRSGVITIALPTDAADKST